MENIKLISKTAIIVFVAVLLAQIVLAKQFTTIFSGGLSSINELFTTESFVPYAKAIDFFFFSFLFIAVYTIGARSAFKEIKRPERIIVILLGLLTAFLLVLGGYSIIMLIPFLPYLLLLLLFMLFWWLLKGIKSPFWRFLLALLLTLLTWALLQGLFDGLAAPGLASTGIGDYFKSFGSSFGPLPSIGGQWPGLTGTGLGDYLKLPDAGPGATVTPVAPVTPPGPKNGGSDDKPGFFSNLASNWWVFLLFMLPLLGLGAFGATKAWKWWKGRKGTEQTPGAEEDDAKLKRILDEIGKIIKLKESIIKALIDISRRKKALSNVELDAYYKITSHPNKINELILNPNFDPAFLLDVESKPHQDLLQAAGAVTDLLKLELQTEENIIKLRIVEELLVGTDLRFEARNDLIKKILAELKTTYSAIDIRKGKLVEWSEYFSKRYIKSQDAYRASPDWYKDALGVYSASDLAAAGNLVSKKLGLFDAFRALKNGNDGLVYKVITSLTKFLVYSKGLSNIDKEMREILDHKKLFHWINEKRYERWQAIGKRKEEELRRYFEEEIIILFGQQSVITQGSKFQAPAFKPDSIAFDIQKQIRYLQFIIKMVNFLESKKKSFTQIQELKVWHMNLENPSDSKAWTDVTQYAITPPGIITPFLLTTNFYEGIPPYKVDCIVNGRRFTIERPNEHVNQVFDKNVGQYIPAITLTSGELGITKPGVYKIIVIPSSAKDTYRRARDTLGVGASKEITIYIKFKNFDPNKVKFDPIWNDPKRDDEQYYTPTPVEIQDVDLSPWFTKIKDQSTLRTCVSFAVCSTYEYMHNRSIQKNVPYVDRDFDVSELFLYYNTRTDKKLDNGCMPSSACISLRQIGVCREEKWPYIPAKVFDTPPADVYTNAKNQTVLGHYALMTDKNTLIYTLLHGNPIIFAMQTRLNFHFAVDDYLEGDIRTPPVFPDKSHALVIVGYRTKYQKTDESITDAFKIRNSWSDEWGNEGYIWIQADYLVALIKEIDRHIVPRILYGLGLGLALEPGKNEGGMKALKQGTVLKALPPGPDNRPLRRREDKMLPESLEVKNLLPGRYIKELEEDNAFELTEETGRALVAKMGELYGLLVNRANGMREIMNQQQLDEEYKKYEIDYTKLIRILILLLRYILRFVDEETAKKITEDMESYFKALESAKSHRELNKPEILRIIFGMVKQVADLKLKVPEGRGIPMSDKPRRQLSENTRNKGQEKLDRAIKGLQGEKKNIIERRKKSKKAQGAAEQIDSLLSDFDKNIRDAKESKNFGFVRAAKDNIQDLTSLTSGSDKPVAHRTGSIRTPYNRTKEKKAGRREIRDD